MSFFENSNENSGNRDIEYKDSLQHSFFRNLDENTTSSNDFQQILNFEIHNSKNMKNEKEFNDQTGNNYDHYLSTKASKKTQDNLWAGNTIYNSNAELLFSGYFGPKVGEEVESYNNYYKSTNPFLEEEKNLRRKVDGNKSNTKLDRSNSKIGFKKPKMNEENFNGSFIGGYNTNKSTNRCNSNNSSYMNTSNNSSSSISFNDLVKNVSLSSMNKKKKKILSSEEILLEKLKKEKEEMQRLRIINLQNAEKTKQFVSKPLNASPLTLLKPFNLSSNNSKMLLKKRGTNQSIEEINHKITETMKKKYEGLGNDLIKIQKTPTNIKYMRKTLGASKSKSKSPIKNTHDDDMQSLSSRIEKYCVISGITAKDNSRVEKSRSKSPLKLCFGNNNKENEEKIFDSHVSTILNSNFTFNSTTSTTSIRRHFNTNNVPTEEKIAKEMNHYKFKARPISKGLFSNPLNTSNSSVTSNSITLINKKQNELETFEMVLQKTRLEKQIIDKREKDMKKLNKINLIKQNKISRLNKENVNTINRNKSSENMNIEN